MILFSKLFISPYDLLYGSSENKESEVYIVTFIDGSHHFLANLYIMEQSELRISHIIIYFIGLI